MYERFTDRARKVLQLAGQEAARFGHDYLGDQHILLGILKEDSGVAASVLKNMNVDLRKVRLEVEKNTPLGSDPPCRGKLPQSADAKTAILNSVKAARDLKHNYVGTEHLLLGLLAGGSEAYYSMAQQALMACGVTAAEVRTEIVNLLAPQQEDDVPVALPVVDDAEMVRRLRALMGNDRLQSLMELARCWPAVEAVLGGRDVTRWAWNVEIVYPGDPPATVAVEATPFFQRGAEDRKAGIEAGGNPYATEEHRLLWLNGWISAENGGT